MKKLMLLGALFLLGGQAQATQVLCDGVPNQTYVSADGRAYVFQPGTPTNAQICNVYAEWKGVKVETCRVWIGYIQQSMATGTNLKISWPDTFTCASIPGYGNAPAPNYIMLGPN